MLDAKNNSTTFFLFSLFVCPDALLTWRLAIPSLLSAAEVLLLHPFLRNVEIWLEGTKTSLVPTRPRIPIVRCRDAVGMKAAILQHKSCNNITLVG